MLLAAGLLALPIAAAPYLVSRERLPLGVVLGRVSRADYVQQVYPAAAVLAALETSGEQARIFPVGEEFQYLSPVPLVLPFYSAAGNRILWAASEETLRAELATAGITHPDQPPQPPPGLALSGAFGRLPRPPRHASGGQGRGGGVSAALRAWALSSCRGQARSRSWLEQPTGFSSVMSTVGRHLSASPNHAATVASGTRSSLRVKGDVSLQSS
jgi:hypothetical protein